MVKRYFKNDNSRERKYLKLTTGTENVHVNSNNYGVK
jgi:hypothetical protein